MAPFRLTESIPEYLRTYIVQQDPSLYTSIDHASWRYILKISKVFFAKYAHKKYLDGLTETGISTERIPLIEEMDHCLRKFNWRAVAVSGFIPPSVFMEYLSLGILPIACDMRKLENIAYTPAPDIVHEAAGHAPIIADPEYRDYLRHYGEVSQKAIYSKHDLEIYHAIRNLSETKEDPHSTEEQIRAAQEQLDRATAAVDHVSEATQLSRMGWWTFEYGLINSDGNPKIYGAGLLSSVGESYHCLGSEVQKIPFSIDCINTSYDITKPQPQLYVSRSFQELAQALRDLSEMMAYKRGGIESLEKAKKAATTTTAQFETGIQISGTLASYATFGKNEVSYLRYQGPTQISFDGQQLEGQGPKNHPEGFGTPLGKLAAPNKSPADLTDAEVSKLGFEIGSDKKGHLQFESGVLIEGELTGILSKNGKKILYSFKNCTVKKGSDILFQPEWGAFDMASGVQIASVFGGPADWKNYLSATGGFHQKPRGQKNNLTDENKNLNELYSSVRALREKKKVDVKALTETLDELEKNFPEDWLLRYELLELNSVHHLNAPWADKVRSRLETIAARSIEKSELINRGLELL